MQLVHKYTRSNSKALSTKLHHYTAVYIQRQVKLGRCLGQYLILMLAAYIG